MRIEIAAQMRCDGCGHINSDLHKGRNQCRECGDIFMWSPKLRAPALKRPLRESDIEKYLVKRVKELGGECRKIQFIGRPGAPDRLVMLPRRKTEVTMREVLARRYETGESLVDAKLTLEMGGAPATIWVELKAPGKKAEQHQAREHERMRKMGQRVVVIDSYEGVDEVLS